MAVVISRFSEVSSVLSVLLKGIFNAKTPRRQAFLLINQYGRQKWICAARGLIVESFAPLRLRVLSQK
jgi:hypothetical protein